jgi:hypothetical protein
LSTFHSIRYGLCVKWLLCTSGGQMGLKLHFFIYTYSMSQKAKLLFIGLLLIAIGALVYLYKHGAWNRQSASPGDNVTVSKVDVSKPLVGFPAGIPLDQKMIVEHDELDYASEGVVLYSISYTSGLQAEELYANYQKFFTQNGFTLVSTSKATKLLYLQASKGGDTTSVTIAIDNGYNLVSLAVLHKK